MLRVEGALPASLPEGQYNVWLNNGLEGVTKGRVVASIFVVAPPAWPTGTFPVGGPCPDIPTCVAMAQLAGGGTVSIPAGTFNMSTNAVLNISGGVQLVGAGQNSTVLVWASNVHPAPPGLLLCRGFGRMADFTAHVTSSVQVALMFDAGTDCTAVRLTVSVVYPSSNASESIRPAFQSIDSSGWALTDSAFTHIGNCSSSWPFNTAYYVGRSFDYLFANNTFLCGCQGHSTDSSVRGVYDGVSVITIGTDAEGDGFSTFNNYRLEYIYFGRGLDIDNYAATKKWETMTFDGPGSAFFGRLSSISLPSSRLSGVTGGGRTGRATDGPTQTLEVLDPPYNHNPDETVLDGLVTIMQGPGLGQVSRVVSALSNGTAWIVSPPFSAPPQTGEDGSLVSIIPYRGGFIWEGNTYINGTTWQLFGVAVDVIAAGNYEQSVGAGMQAWGRMYQGGWQPNTRIVFDYNTLRCSGNLTATSDPEATPIPPVPFVGQ